MKRETGEAVEQRYGRLFYDGLDLSLPEEQSTAMFSEKFGILPALLIFLVIMST